MAVAISSREFSCSFCQASFYSEKSLCDHLMLCGNKTDQCPNCRKFIRRAIFAYHYENNCASFDDNDDQTKHSVNHRSSSKINNDEEKFSHRPSSSTKTKTTKLCRYCENECERSEYDIHKKHCLKNPRNNRQTGLLTSNDDEINSSTSEDLRSKDVDRIPCEICGKQIRFKKWETHTKSCKEKDDRRIQDRAKEISAQPLHEKSSCEYCKEEFLIDKLQRHEMLCEKNPEYLAALRSRNVLLNSTTNSMLPRETLTNYSSFRPSSRSARDRSPTTEDLLNRIDDRVGRDTLHNPSFQSHLSIDIRQNSTTLMPRTNDRLSFSRIEDHLPTTTDDQSSLLMNSVDRPSMSLHNNHFTSTAQSLPYRNRSAVSVDRSSISRPIERDSIDIRQNPTTLMPRTNDRLSFSRTEDPLPTTTDGQSSLLMNSVDHPSMSLQNSHFTNAAQSLPYRNRSAASVDRSSISRPIDRDRPLPTSQSGSTVHRLPRAYSATRSSIDSRGSHRAPLRGHVDPPTNSTYFFRDADQERQPVMIQPKYVTIRSRPAWKHW